MRRRVYQWLGGEGESAGRGELEIPLLILITLNVIVVMAETVEEISLRLGFFLRIFEIFSVAIFTVEYLLRVWSCVEDPRFQNSLRGRLRFMLTPLALVDLAAILPFYLPFLGVVDLRILRILRLSRLFRILKLARYLQPLRLILTVLRQQKEELSITFMIEIILLLLAASGMYYVEHEHQPDNFSSIPAAMWWAVCTLTTVGYGDIYPMTPLGKLFGSLIALIGIAAFALPAGIITAGFMEELGKKESGPIICPHCGKELP